MEFETAEPILKRFTAAWTTAFSAIPPCRSLTEATLTFLQTRYGWVADPSWIVWLPGVVPGFNLACRCAGAPEDHVMMTTPVYYPFFAAPENGGRQRIEVPLVRDGANGSWASTRSRPRSPRPPVSFCAIPRPQGGCIALKNLKRWEPSPNAMTCCFAVTKSMPSFCSRKRAPINPLLS